MRFVVVPYSKARVQKLSGTDICYLVADSWDDYGYKCSYRLTYFDENGNEANAGIVKIGKSAMELGRLGLPETFSELPNDFFSLGQEQGYYETLAELPFYIRSGILRGLGDIIYDQDRWITHEKEPVFQISLLRSIGPSSLRIFENVLRHVVQEEGFSFSYEYPDSEGSLLTFETRPGLQPPTNVHVLIGRNGVGKTHLLRNLAAILTTPTKVADSFGTIRFYSPHEEVGTTSKKAFANLVTVSFSAFDPFPPPEHHTNSLFYEEGEESTLRPTYVGLKHVDDREAFDKDGDAIDLNGTSGFRLKSLSELHTEFLEVAYRCTKSAKRKTWQRAMQVLETDPLLAELRLGDVDPSDLRQDDLAEAFKKASSGHKVVLLTVSALVDSVADRSLVLIDEPETHLHPPLQAALIRAISGLLSERNGVAIVATHSPVLLQEVPKDCVWMLYRSGSTITAERPTLESFAENVGVLTREVFRLETTESGYHSLLAKEFERQHDFQGVMNAFAEHVGTEGRTLVRSMARARRK